MRLYNDIIAGGPRRPYLDSGSAAQLAVLDKPPSEKVTRAKSKVEPSVHQRDSLAQASHAVIGVAAMRTVIVPFLRCSQRPSSSLSQPHSYQLITIRGLRGYQSFARDQRQASPNSSRRRNMRMLVANNARLSTISSESRNKSSNTRIEEATRHPLMLPGVKQRRKSQRSSAAASSEPMQPSFRLSSRCNKRRTFHGDSSEVAAKRDETRSRSQDQPRRVRCTSQKSTVVPLKSLPMVDTVVCFRHGRYGS